MPMDKQMAKLTKNTAKYSGQILRIRREKYLRQIPEPWSSRARNMIRVNKKELRTKNPVTPKDPSQKTLLTALTEGSSVCGRKNGE